MLGAFTAIPKEPELNGAALRLCALARISLLIQSVVLAKAQRRKGRKGKILAMVVLNSQRLLLVTTWPSCRVATSFDAAFREILANYQFALHFSAELLDGLKKNSNCYEPNE